MEKQEAFEHIENTINKGRSWLRIAAPALVEAGLNRLDEFIDAVLNETENRLMEQGHIPSGPSEPVRREPDIENKRVDVIAYYTRIGNHFGAEAAKDHNVMSDNLVASVWSGLPDEDKSWVRTNGHSPL